MSKCSHDWQFVETISTDEVKLKCSKCSAEDIFSFVPKVQKEEAQIYVRTSLGETKYMPVKEALQHFLSDEGYRMTIEFGDMEIILRKNSILTPEWISLDEKLNQQSVESVVTIRGVL